MIGKTISYFKILEKLGEGGMGVVYRAEDTRLMRTVAIKLLPGEIAAKGEEQGEEQERLMTEARAAAALNHPNIATIHSIDESEGTTFIVMEYIDGRELREVIGSKPMRLNEALDIATQVARGLRAAHDSGVIHRDIKSSNVILTGEGQAKITDFGLAKLSGLGHLTKPGSTVGTVRYMSPEQITAADVDHRTDLWSFGVLLYEMLTGELPFTGDYEAAVIYKILNEEPRALQSVRADVPDHIASLVAGLLQKDLRSRVSSAGDLMAGLQRSSSRKLPRDTKKSVAVLYFENMSSDRENEYFCAGMTEDLITDLSKIRGLRVIPRTDVLPFRNREVNSRQVGETLRVDYILEGSVRKAGNRIRTTAQLIDVGSGFQIWAERYDRLIEDIFDVQVEVSENIAEALKVSLTDSEKRSLAKKPTDDVRAYDFYLRGSELLSTRGHRDRQTAIKMFEHALSIDPNFALAYVALAEAYSWNHLFLGADRIWLEKMMDANERALSLDPDLIEAQFGIGMVYFHQRRIPEATRSFKEVVKIRDDFYPAHFWLGITSNMQEEFDTAIKYSMSAAAIKPYSEEPWHHLDVTYRLKGDLDGARRAGDKVIELGERKLEVNPDDAITLTRVALTYAARGETQRAIEAVNRVTKMGTSDGIVLYNCAGVYSSLDMKDKAVDCLRKAFEAGMIMIKWMEYDPFITAGLREYSDFQDLISRYGL